MTWAHPEADANKITLHDLYKINYSWPLNGTVAGHWDTDVGLNYSLTQFKYSRRQDMRGIVFTAGLAVCSSITCGIHSRNAMFALPSEDSPRPEPQIVLRSHYIKLSL